MTMILSTTNLQQERLCVDKLRLADGAVLENAAIYSHANYLANGDLTDRTTSEPVASGKWKCNRKGYGSYIR